MSLLTSCARAPIPPSFPNLFARRRSPVPPLRPTPPRSPLFSARRDRLDPIDVMDVTKPEMSSTDLARSLIRSMLVFDSPSALRISDDDNTLIDGLPAASTPSRLLRRRRRRPSRRRAPDAISSIEASSPGRLGTLPIMPWTFRSSRNLYHRESVSSERDLAFPRPPYLPTPSGRGHTSRRDATMRLQESRDVGDFIPAGIRVPDRQVPGPTLRSPLHRPEGTSRDPG
jgi:hypothetical protein